MAAVAWILWVRLRRPRDRFPEEAVEEGSPDAMALRGVEGQTIHLEAAERNPSSKY